MTTKRFLAVLTRHAVFIAVLTAIIVAVTAAFTFRQEDRYRASALVEVQAPVAPDGTISLQGTLSARERAVTIARLGGTRSVRRRAEARLDEGALQGLDCSVSQQGQSEFLSASCEGPSAEVVAQAANATATALRGGLENQRLERVRELTRQYRLQIRQLRADGVAPELFPTQPIFPNSRELQIVEVATPPVSAFSPNPQRAIAIALILGLIINSALAVLLEFAQDKPHQIADVERAVGEPILGTIPILKRRSPPGRPQQASGSPPEEAQRHRR